MPIVALGEALIDLVPPRGESPATAAHLSIEPGGAPLNIAIGLARLGVDSLFLGCLSSDAFGSRLASLLETEGVRRRPEPSVENPTRLAVVDHLNTASPFRFYGDATADTLLSAAQVEATLNETDVSGLYVGSLMMTNPNARTVQERALDQAVERGVPVFSDPNPRPAAWRSQGEMIEATDYLLRRSSLAKLSLDDARALGWTDGPDELLHWCAERYDAQIFVTGGARGSWTLRNGDLIHAEAPPVAVNDPTGAGDASFAALIFQHQLAGAIGENQLRFAAAAGALATLKDGAISGLPNFDEIQEMMNS